MKTKLLGMESPGRRMRSKPKGQRELLLMKVGKVRSLHPSGRGPLEVECVQSSMSAQTEHLEKWMRREHDEHEGQTHGEGPD